MHGVGAGFPADSAKAARGVRSVRIPMSLRSLLVLIRPPEINHGSTTPVSLDLITFKGPSSKYRRRLSFHPFHATDS